MRTCIRLLRAVNAMKLAADQPFARDVRFEATKHHAAPQFAYIMSLLVGALSLKKDRKGAAQRPATTMGRAMQPATAA